MPYAVVRILGTTNSCVFWDLKSPAWCILL